ncbi:unnamed protein product [Ectocarpus sp. 4 AP-2014]
MQNDADIQMFFTKVDGSFPGRHQDLQPIITWKSSTTPIATEFRLPIPVEHSGSVIDYSFETLHNDVQFAILFEEADDSKGGGAFSGDGGVAEDGQEEVIVEPQKVESQLGPITGTIPLTRPGRLTLVWDNGHSWFKHKILSYSVTLHVPSLLATEKAKCGRAVNALRACVRSRDDAHARGAEAVLERKEATSTVERLEEELREMQAKLDGATRLAEQLEREVDDCQQREYLEGRKIQGLTFRLMPEEILIRTLSYGSEEDEWLTVCRDWLEALSPSSGGSIDDAGSHE